MSTGSVFIGSTHSLIRTLQLSMRNPRRGSDTTIRMGGGGISRNVTWIQRCPRTIGVQAFCVNGHVKRSLPGFRVNLLVAKGLYREAESPLSTAAAIPRSELTLPCMSQLINAIVGSVSRIRTPAVKSSTIGVERQRALVITAMTMPKIGIEARTTAKTRIGIGTRDLSETQGVVAETLHRIIVARVDDHKKRAGDSRDKKDGQDTRERRRDFSPHPARDRSGNCECAQVDKLMMIITMYARFSMLRW